MLDELVKILPDFLGKKAHVRCMSHTVNLTAKGVLRSFEPTKTGATDDAGAATGGHAPPDIGLQELYAELRNIEENGDEEDDVDGFVDVLDQMTVVEREEWYKNVEPVKNALQKVNSEFRKIPMLFSDYVTIF